MSQKMPGNKLGLGFGRSSPVPDECGAPGTYMSEPTQSSHVVRAPEWRRCRRSVDEALLLSWRSLGVFSFECRTIQISLAKLVT